MNDGERQLRWSVEQHGHASMRPPFSSAFATRGPGSYLSETWTQCNYCIDEDVFPGGAFITAHVGPCLDCARSLVLSIRQSYSDQPVSRTVKGVKLSPQPHCRSTRVLRCGRPHGSHSPRSRGLEALAVQLALGWRTISLHARAGTHRGPKHPA